MHRDCGSAARARMREIGRKLMQAAEALGDHDLELALDFLEAFAEWLYEATRIAPFGAERARYGHLLNLKLRAMNLGYLLEQHMARRLELVERRN